MANSGSTKWRNSGTPPEGKTSLISTLMKAARHRKTNAE